MGHAAPRLRVRRLHRILIFCLAMMLWLFLPGSGARSQNPNPPEVQAHEGPSQEAQPPFRLHVERNLVTVKVVVRDAKGRPVGNLHQEDFRLFDAGKPQDILGFSVETGSPSLLPEPAPPAPPPAEAEETTVGRSVPLETVAQRFVILYFDDFHLDAEGVERTRLAAWRYVLTAVRPQDRVAIFTATGKYQIDFTRDRDKIHDALLRLAPWPRAAGSCPQLSDYEAYLVTKQAPEALHIAHVEAIQCDCGVTLAEGVAGDVSALRPKPALGPGTTSGVDPCPELAAREVEMDAQAVWDLAHLHSQSALEGIEAAVRRLETMPGQRTLVLVSPGFLSETEMDKIDALTRHALQHDVVISAIDAQGLAAQTYRHNLSIRPDLSADKILVEDAGTVAAQDVLASLSAGTGGVFFHNSNDFNEGFRQAAEVPEVYYVLTFSPPDIKLDGKFHPLKVTLNALGPYTVQARRGYFASATGLAGPATGRDEMQKAVWSLDEYHGLGARVTAQADQANGPPLRLTVTVHLDVRQLQFHQEGDRSVDKLMFTTTIFDRDGNYMAAKEESLDLHLKEATLARLTATGLNATTAFPLKPGTYRIREVVRETASTGRATLNCVAEVPGAGSPNANPPEAPMPN
jgi:VWFA-related protein